MVTQHRITVPLGQPFEQRMPWSEVCLHMNIADKVMTVVLIGENPPYDTYAQLYKDGEPFSFPITHGEAGILYDPINEEFFTYEER